MGANLDLDQLARLEAVPPAAGLLERRPLPRDVGHERGDIFRRPDVGDPHAEELVAPVAVLGDRRVVDLEERERL
jgi:hypothetical protein